MTPQQDMRRRVLRKVYRESTKDLALRALLRFVEKTANDCRYTDGFVEWNVAWPLLEEAVEYALADLPATPAEPTGEGESK